MGPVLTELIQTSSVHPSQWEGFTERGRYFFAHYRAETLSWGFGETLDDAKILAMTTCPRRHFQTSRDGMLTTGELLDRLGLEYRPGMIREPANKPLKARRELSKKDLETRLNKVEEENADHIRELAESEAKCRRADRKLQKMQAVPLLGRITTVISEVLN